MKDNEGVSIGIPIFNAEKYLEHAIISVINQNYKEWELILVDDGSTDKSMEIANKYSKLDQRIKVISDGENKKLPFRLNQIINLSQYNYIARMDADDIMHPDRIRFQIDYMKSSPEIDIVATSYYSIDRNEKIVDLRSIDINRFDKKDFLKGNYFICHPSIMAKKNWFLRNLYNDKYERAEDYELWLRALLNDDFKIHVIPDLLMFYREDGSVNKEKLIKSYYTTLSIFSDKRKMFSSYDYGYVVFRNFIKIFLVKFLYSKYFEKFLVKKRSKGSKKTFNHYVKDFVDFDIN